MNLDDLKQSIKDKELRMSQLRSMDSNQLEEQDKKLIESLEVEIKELKERLKQE